MSGRGRVHAPWRCRARLGFTVERVPSLPLLLCSCAAEGMQRCCLLPPYLLRRAQENNREMSLVQMCLVCLAQLMWAIVEYLT